MPKQKLIIVPVTLHSENENLLATNSSLAPVSPVCTIKTATAELSVFHGVDEHLIRIVMRELKNIYIICGKTDMRNKVVR
ncbi:hypothetical protein [Peribacillus butanolivorans]|uniref:hypothetical protein n=1 Tax=Peribacillus butanolivorans TaxID=421767 RepID=UPI0035D9AE66